MIYAIVIRWFFCYFLLWMEEDLLSSPVTQQENFKA
jgi:hypothetical protein